MSFDEINAACGITQADLDIVAMSVRADQAEAEIAGASDSFAAYWASTPSASVLRDYRAGRVVSVGAR